MLSIFVDEKHFFNNYITVNNVFHVKVLSRFTYCSLFMHDEYALNNMNEENCS